MTRTQIYLPEEMVLQIKLAAKRQNVKMSELIREFLAKGLNNHDKKTKKKTLADMVGILNEGGFDCKPEELSKKIDEIVYA